MPKPSKRQPRVPISVSLLHPDWVRAQRAAGMRGQTLSEFGRAAIIAATESAIGPRKLPGRDEAPRDAAA